MDNSRFKFRAWYPDSQQMTYSDRSNWGAWGDCEMSDMVSGSCEIMQFTGLYDYDDREIYEGDLLETNCGIGIVVFYTGGFTVDFEGYKIALFGGKIIGNIHEHPNLLKL